MTRSLALLALLALHAAPTPAASLDVDRALAASRAAIGSQPGDAGLTGTDGRRTSLAAFRGKPLVVSFVYTACSQVCPTTTRYLSKAVAEARTVVGAGTFEVVSIGFDPPADNPMSMRVFARQQGVDDPRWHFVVLDAGARERVARDFGFSYSASAGGYEHLTQVTVLDAQGRVHAQVNGESFALPMLVQPLKELVLGAPPAAPGSLTWLERARLICTIYDPLADKYRLDFRLFIELGVGISVLGAIAAFLLRERRRARLAR
ncbi:SCO family protein [Usitatibacter palustris]|uniref:Thioredoxin domain-containing protein n=1 Tax=Usitatibacter palustris TaxID=2732487 RepID=A0A6M4H515_9PROT|nr:SCO family protein [Usitatibacter palustris]QJR14255.1 hypothetical protein DSM104440_01048 [Usitatibacter palustris]